MTTGDQRAVEIAEAEIAEDESLKERRLRFLSMRNAGGTFAGIADRWNNMQRQAVERAGGDPATAKRVSSVTVRKDVEAAKLEIVGSATREGMIAEAYSVILDVRRANYAAMLDHDVDAAKLVLSTVRDQRELFGLDQPKRMAVGVGTDVEFAEALFSLVKDLGDGVDESMKELAAVARQDRDFVDAEVVELPPAAVDPIPADDWTNLTD